MAFANPWAPQAPLAIDRPRLGDILLVDMNLWFFSGIEWHRYGYLLGLNYGEMKMFIWIIDMCIYIYMYMYIGGFIYLEELK